MDLRLLKLRIHLPRKSALEPQEQISAQQAGSENLVKNIWYGSEFALTSLWIMKSGVDKRNYKRMLFINSAGRQLILLVEIPKSLMWGRKIVEFMIYYKYGFWHSRL